MIQQDLERKEQLAKEMARREEAALMQNGVHSSATYNKAQANQMGVNKSL